MTITIQSLIQAIEKAKIYAPSVYVIEDCGVHVPHIIDADTLIQELKKMEE